MSVGTVSATQRPMRWWDLASVHRIEQEVFGATAWSLESFWAELAHVPSTRCYLVASNHGEVVGYAGLMTVDGEADVQTIAVAPAYRGAGIGAALLTSLVDEAVSRACTHVLLEVAAENSAAQRLYERHGFSVIARRSGYYGSGADALVMRRLLHGARETSDE